MTATRDPLETGCPLTAPMFARPAPPRSPERELWCAVLLSGLEDHLAGRDGRWLDTDDAARVAALAGLELWAIKRALAAGTVDLRDVGRRPGRGGRPRSAASKMLRSRADSAQSEELPAQQRRELEVNNSRSRIP